MAKESVTGKENVEFVEIGNVKYINEHFVLQAYRNYLRSLINNGVIEINERNEDYFKLIDIKK